MKEIKKLNQHEEFNEKIKLDFPIDSLVWMSFRRVIFGSVNGYIKPIKPIDTSEIDSVSVGAITEIINNGKIIKHKAGRCWSIKDIILLNDIEINNLKGQGILD